MMRRGAKAGLTSILLLISAACSSPQRTPADLVVINAVIYTNDSANPWAESLAVGKGRLVHVGAARDADRYIGPQTRSFDARGRLILPAFHDAHVHPVSAGIELGLCDLNGAASVPELLERISTYASTHPDAPWIVGGGWDITLFDEGRAGKKMLDGVVSDRPVLLSSADGHSSWVNSKALAVAGITRDTPDPPRGRIERDVTTKEPSGTLREEAAELVRSHAPESTDQEHRDGLKRALAEINKFGIVSFQEASASRRITETYLAAEREGWLTARVRVALRTDPAEGETQVPRLVEWRAACTGRRVSCGTAKIYVDGVIEGRTASLLAPYVTPAGMQPPAAPSGIANFEPAALDALVTRLDKEQFQVHMHAIGDRAIRMGLDAIGAARRKNGPRDARHHLAHIQLFDPADIPRFAALGVVANFQPFWAYADSYITDLTEPFLGPERSRWLYPIRSLFDSGAIIAAGSDWSVSSVNPLDGIQVAVTRRALDDPEGKSWLPEQTVSLTRILNAYTMAGAFVNFEDNDSGSLTIGKYADFIVLDRDIFKNPVTQIHEAKVLWTVMEGSEVYRAPEL